MPENKKMKMRKDPVKSRNIHQSITFSCTPMELYNALMNSDTHSEFTGSTAVISNRETGKFTAYDGWIEGKNLKLIPGKKIVQYWRGGDWPKGHYSIVEYEFFPIQNGTKLVFSQKDVPAQFYSDISKGWREHYWEKMKAFFGNKEA